MKSMLLIAAAGLFLAASSYAYALDITSDPDATMTQQQKLGPNATRAASETGSTPRAAPTRTIRATATIGTTGTGAETGA